MYTWTCKPLPLRSAQVMLLLLYMDTGRHTQIHSQTQNHTKIYTTHNNTDRHTDTCKHTSRHIQTYKQAHKNTSRPIKHTDTLKQA